MNTLPNEAPVIVDVEVQSRGVPHGTEETIWSYKGDYLLRSWDAVAIPGSVQPSLIQHSLYCLLMAPVSVSLNFGLDCQS